MKLEEITIERLDEAYRKTGTKPGREFMDRHAMEICPLAVLGRELGCHWGEVFDGDRELASQFAEGFDGIRPKANVTSIAYELGRLVAKHYRAKGFDVGMTGRIGDAIPKKLS